MSAMPETAAAVEEDGDTEKVRAGIKLPNKTDNHCSERVWPAAHGLLEFMQQREIKGRMLELGAGTGWMALVYARQHPDDVHISCSDHPDYMQPLHQCLQMNNVPNVDAIPLDWADPGNIEGPWDWIIGSDLVYNESLCTLITAAWAGLMAQHPAAKTIYAHSLNRWADFGFDWPLHQAAVAAGIVFKPLRVDGADITGDDVSAVHIPDDRKVCVIFEVLRGSEMPPLATKILRAAMDAGERKRREEWDKADEEERAEIRMAEEIASISW